MTEKQQAQAVENALGGQMIKLPKHRIVRRAEYHFEPQRLYLGVWWRRLNDVEYSSAERAFDGIETDIKAIRQSEKDKHVKQIIPIVIPDRFYKL